MIDLCTIITVTIELACVCVQNYVCFTMRMVVLYSSGNRLDIYGTEDYLTNTIRSDCSSIRRFCQKVCALLELLN